MEQEFSVDVRISSVRSEWDSGTYLLTTLVCLAIVAASGCRTLRDRGSNQHLSQARQLSLRGTDAIERQRYQDAELFFSEALKQSEGDDRAHWGYATTLWNRGEKAKAIEHMEEAVRLSERTLGSNPEYSIRLGEMYLETGNLAQARERAEIVLGNRRRYPAAWALLGDTHTAEKNWKVALECYQHALLYQADYPKVQLALAEVYRNLGKPQRALAVLDRMVDLHDTASHDPVALLNRGLALADLNRNVEAAEALVKASERLPSDQIDKHLQIVYAQHRIGELVAARLTLGKVREVHSGSQDVQRLQSMLDMSFAHLSSPVNSRTPRTAMQEMDWGGSGLPPPGMASSYTAQPAILSLPVSGQDSMLRR